MPEISWPTWVDRAVRQQVEDVVRPVVDAGGAVGWTSTPTSAALDAWLDNLFEEVRAGDARLAFATVDGVVQGLGRWHRVGGGVFAHNAEIRQLMVHPGARGLGLGRLLVGALVTDAGEHDLEHLTLEVRGNNAGAMRLYESFGFLESGLLPNYVAIGNERWDRVQFHLQLQVPDGVVTHGRAQTGAGASA